MYVMNVLGIPTVKTISMQKLPQAHPQRLLDIWSFHIIYAGNWLKILGPRQFVLIPNLVYSTNKSCGYLTFFETYSCLKIYTLNSQIYTDYRIKILKSLIPHDALLSIKKYDFLRFTMFDISLSLLASSETTEYQVGNYFF